MSGSAHRNARRRADLERRRQRARASAAAARRKRRRRRIVVLCTIGALLALTVGGVALVANRGESAPSKELTAEVVDSATGALGITTPPDAYAATYRVDRYDASSSTPLTEQYTIKRPFDSKVVGLDGAPPGTTVQWTAITNLGRFSYTPTSGTAQIGRATPRTAAGDLRLDATLDDLVASGMFTARERRTLLGRECQTYRTGKGVETFEVAAATDTDYVDVCIDGSGLMLEEITIGTGKATQHTIATAIDTTATPADDTFAITGTDLALADGGMELHDIDKATAPVAGYWAVAPEGYEHVARYRALAPGETTDTTTSTTATTAPPPPKETYIDVFQKGRDFVVVQQGPKAAEPTSDAKTDTVQVGALGEGQLQVAVAGSNLLTHPTAPADWFVLVSGSLGKDDLLAVGATAKAA